MLYVTLTFWLIVSVFTAWGVHTLWSRLVKPRAVNAALLPGTLVAQLGHVLGLLVTGNAVTNTSLMSDGEKGEPQADAPETPKIPIIGSILIGLLPLVACAACLYVSAQYWGGGILPHLASEGSLSLPQSLPTSLAGVWELLRTTVTLSEGMLAAIVAADWPNWTTILFLYLSICLTVRMMPFEGSRRGALGAILLAGGATWAAASFAPGVEGFVLGAWTVLSYAVAMLILLLFISLAVTGAVGLVRILAKNE